MAVRAKVHQAAPEDMLVLELHAPVLRRPRHPAKRESRALELPAGAQAVLIKGRLDELKVPPCHHIIKHLLPIQLLVNIAPPSSSFIHPQFAGMELRCVAACMEHHQL